MRQARSVFSYTENTLHSVYHPCFVTYCTLTLVFNKMSFFSLNSGCYHEVYKCTCCIFLQFLLTYYWHKQINTVLHGWQLRSKSCAVCQSSGLLESIRDWNVAMENVFACIWTMSDPVRRWALSKSSQRGIFLFLYSSADSSRQSLYTAQICKTLPDIHSDFLVMVLKLFTDTLLFTLLLMWMLWCICRHDTKTFSHLSAFFFFFFQNMDKTQLPSVTLIVGCGVSSLTLLLLIIIYVSVWRWDNLSAIGNIRQKIIQSLKVHDKCISVCLKKTLRSLSISLQSCLISNNQ